MVKFIETLRTSRVSYLKKALKTLNVMIHEYKKRKIDLMLNFEPLRKPVELLHELTRTLYNKKLRNKEEKEKKRIGALKNILSEKMTNSLQHFTSRNIAL